MDTMTKEPEAAEPLSLIPAERPVGELLDVPLNELPFAEDIPGANPDASFIQSVREFGVSTPVALIRRPDHAPIIDGLNPFAAYDIAAGRRRIKAAIAVGLETIPALVYPAGTAPEAITLSENAQRSENPMIELETLERLLAAGQSEAAIFRATGLLPQTQRKRLLLGKLLQPLREAVTSGKMAVGTAEQAAKLSHSRQEELVAMLQAGKKQITGKDVAKTGRAERSAAIASLPASLFGTPEAPRATPEEQAAALIFRAIKLLPAGKARLDLMEAWIAIKAGPEEEIGLAVGVGWTADYTARRTLAEEELDALLEDGEDSGFDELTEEEERAVSDGEDKLLAAQEEAKARYFAGPEVEHGDE